MLSAAAAPLSAAAETDNCASAANPIVCENALPGDPPANWQIEGTGDPTIQGFATAISVNVGETEYFKIATDARSYRIEILRLGYYGGDGARLITTLRPSASLPQSQPECLKYSSTGLIDCGNWAVSASWRVPEGAVSGVYIALLTREDTGGQSQIPFVVRNDASHASILLQTSDATWEAYNDWGGNSLYSCAVDCPPGDPEGYKAAYAVSYNRPWEGSFAIDGGRSYLWYAEYQLIYWLEENGYNVSYTTSAEVGRQPALLKNHSIFISSGHDEYWSASQRKAVEEALAAGVSLAFFSGNEMFWKTRWAPSTEGANVPDRTLITYKETHFNAPVDPEDPPTWTGSWRDPRFSPPADGGKPESALTGQYFLVNSGTADLTVPYRYSKLRLWRNTAVAALVPGQSLMLSPGTGTLGYEWDETVENGFRPPGELELSETTVSGLQTFVDYGSNVTEPSTATHHLTLYRAPSGALVFGAGTVQWSWGLANVNAWSSLTTDPSGNPPDPNMEQFTVNLLAEMGAQPGSLIAGLLPGTKAAPGAPPSATITQPSEGASFEDGTRQTIAGTAQAHAGGAVAAVEVSTDGGASWHAATITGADEESVSWTYPWVAHGAPTSTIEARAVDEEGEIGSPSAPVNATVRCPCSIWGIGEKPANVDSGDGSSVELGVKFTADEYGWIDGVRFYRSAANSGAHIVGLWSEAGALLASATQTAEGEAGWEQVDFPSPVQIEAHRTYIAGYFAPHGHYSADPYYFYSPPATGSATLGSPPLQAVQATSQSSNGLYLYTSSPAEPTESYNATNYWVDPLFTPAALPGVPTAIAAAPQAGAAIVSWSPPAEGGPVTEYIVTPYAGTSALAPTIVRGTPPEATAVVSGLTPGQSYTFAVQAANPNGKGPLSARSAAITPPAYAAPSAVRAVLARPAGHSALVSWSAPSLDGGEPITSYTITPFIGSAAQSPITVGQQARSA
ncbi:MAG TPA: N,N-dimethylformamidase beta subunit family domain-containing protein, partial [Solirubrobacteraceae bacterium]|nr:N,N-dimethylformamidase beta subunit family domain-containing protein [Solirubrobacteraceae bacterium]